LTYGSSPAGSTVPENWQSKIIHATLSLPGGHALLGADILPEQFEAPPGKPLTVASYIGGDLPTAYVESIGVGDALPSLPIFLSETRYIPAPLEVSYQQAWAVFPAILKEIIDPTSR